MNISGDVCKSQSRSSKIFDQLLAFIAYLSRQNQIHQRTILLPGSHIYNNTERLRGPLAKQITSAIQIIEHVDKLYIFWYCFS
jgi:hypothetical protein